MQIMQAELFSKFVNYFAFYESDDYILFDDDNYSSFLIRIYILLSSLILSMLRCYRIEQIDECIA